MYSHRNLSLNQNPEHSEREKSPDVLVSVGGRGFPANHWVTGNSLGDRRADSSLAKVGSSAMGTGLFPQSVYKSSRWIMLKTLCISAYMHTISRIFLCTLYTCKKKVRIRGGRKPENYFFLSSFFFNLVKPSCSFFCFRQKQAGKNCREFRSQLASEVFGWPIQQRKRISFKSRFTGELYQIKLFSNRADLSTHFTHMYSDWIPSTYIRCSYHCAYIIRNLYRTKGLSIGLIRIDSVSKSFARIISGEKIKASFFKPRLLIGTNS